MRRIIEELAKFLLHWAREERGIVRERLACDTMSARLDMGNVKYMRTNLDVETTVGRQKIVYALRDTLLEGRDAVGLFGLEVELVVKGDHSALRK